MSPVSSSSSFSRQQRAQPSHRLSHSASDISSKVLVFQKNPSWSEGGFGGAVINPRGPEVNSRPRKRPVWSGRSGSPSHNGFDGAGSKAPKIASPAIGL